MPRTKLTSDPNRRGKAVPLAQQRALKNVAAGKANRAVKKEPITINGNPKRKHRWHAGTVALRDIKKLQKTTNPLLKKTPTKRIIKEILDSLNASNSTGVIRITKAAVQALIDKADAFMTEFLGEAGHEATKAKRKTIMIQDIREAKRLHVDFLTMDRRPQYQHKSPKEEQPEDQPESIVPVDAPEQLEESTDEEYVDAAQPEEPPSEPDETASA